MPTNNNSQQPKLWPSSSLPPARLTAPGPTPSVCVPPTGGWLPTGASAQVLAERRADGLSQGIGELGKQSRMGHNKLTAGTQMVGVDAASWGAVPRKAAAPQLHQEGGW